MLESKVSQKLRKEFVARGAVCWKMSDRFHASRPDLFVAYKGSVSFIETKVHPNTPTSLQKLTLNELYNVEMRTYIATYYDNCNTLKLEDGAGVQTLFYDIREAVSWVLKQHS